MDVIPLHGHRSHDDSLIDAMKACNLAPEKSLNADSQIHRFHVSGDRTGSKNGWYILHHHDDYQLALFGSWKTGQQEQWLSKSAKALSADQIRDYRQKFHALEQARKEEQQRVQRQAASDCLSIWEQAGEADPHHPYLVCKGITPCGIRQRQTTLLIPVYDGETMISLQFIWQDESGAFQKRFKSGGRKKGGYFYIGQPEGQVYLCEGFATAVTLHQASGGCVVCAFDSGNLEAVARAIEGYFPGCAITIAADNDHQSPGNPGLLAAMKAARSKGASVVYPEFDRQEVGTDFNDLAQSHGLQAVTGRIKTRGGGGIAIGRPSCSVDGLRVYRQDQDKPQFPGHLLKAGGVMDSISGYLNATAYRPQPLFFLNAAMTLTALLTNRQIETPTGLRLNEYFVNLGPSGCGKDHARKAMKELLRGLQKPYFIGGDELASGQGLINRVNQNPNVVFMLDELGLFLKAVMSPTASSHQAQIIKSFMQLYTSSASTHIGAEYADQRTHPRKDTPYPHAYLYGSSSPGEFWSALKSSHVLSGFVTRLLISETDIARPEPNRNPASLKEIPETIHTWLKNFEQTGVAAGRSADQPERMAFSKEAIEAVDQYEQEIAKPAIESCDDIRATLYTRAFEHISKLATIHTLSGDPAQRVINCDSVIWAIDYVQYSLQLTTWNARLHMADSEYQGHYNDMLQAIRTCGEKGVTTRELNRPPFTRWPKKLREEILEQLVTGGLVAHGVVRQHSCKPRQAWVALVEERLQ